jgi:hypothetical protein
MRFRWFFGGTMLGMVIGAILMLVVSVGAVGIAALALGARPGNVHAWRSPQGTIATVYLMRTEGPRSSEEGHRAITAYLTAAETCVKMEGVDREWYAFVGLRSLLHAGLAYAKQYSEMERYLWKRSDPLLPDTPLPSLPRSAPPQKPDTETLGPLPSDRRF